RGVAARRRRPRGGGATARYPNRRVRRGARAGDALGHGRRADDVPRDRLLRRQGGRRHRARVPRRAAAARHGDDPVSSHRPRDSGRDLARGPVEVGPTAHFMMGGVVVDPDCRTATEGLFAAGEDTGGVHGANRLGGNGVAESTVFGGLAGDVMAAHVAGRALPRVSEAALQAAAVRVAMPRGRGDAAEVYAIQRELREVMWERAGPVRDAEGLAIAATAVERLAERLRGAGVPGHGALNTAWQDWLDLDSQLTAARLLIASALARRESRGAHWRRDFPAPVA